MARNLTGTALALVLAGFLFATGPAVADATIIKVNAPGNSLEGVDLSTDSLGSRDVVGISYPLQGGSDRVVTGWSLKRVLEVAAAKPGAAGWLDRSSLPSVSLAPPSTDVGAQIRVSSDEILDQGIFGGGRTPVFVENEDGSLTFIKPGINGSPGGAYRYSVSVEIRVEKSRPTGKSLGLRISPRGVDRGEKISFAVTVPGRSAQGLRFNWTIRETGSGRTIEFSSRGGTVSRSFSRKGSYTALVTLAEVAGFLPAAGSFTVGPGPRRKERDRDRGEPSGPAPTPSSGDSAPTISAAIPDPGISGTGTGPGAGGAVADREDRAEDRRDLPVPDGLEQVSGELLGPDVQVVEVPPEEFASQSAGPSEVDQGPGFLGGAAGEAATLLGVGLLMALGGLIEARVLSRRS